MEFWDIVDKDGNPTGKKIKRGKITLRRGEYHPVVHIWIFYNNKFLIQKRSSDKQPMAGEWAATSGAVVSGESSKDAAKRELKEELSVNADSDELSFVARMPRKNSVLDIYSLHKNVDIDDLTLQSDEVECVKWVSVEQLKSMIKNGDFHNYGFEYFNHIFSLIK